VLFVWLRLQSHHAQHEQAKAEEAAELKREARARSLKAIRETIGGLEPGDDKKTLEGRVVTSLHSLLDSFDYN
jgi:hypothetical protein